MLPYRSPQKCSDSSHKVTPLFTHSVHSLHFTPFALHSLNSIRSLHSLRSFRSLTQFIPFVHSVCSFRWLISFIPFAHSIRSKKSFLCSKSQNIFGVTGKAAYLNYSKINLSRNKDEKHYYININKINFFCIKKDI